MPCLSGSLLVVEPQSLSIFSVHICILTKKFRASNDIWIQVFLQSQIKVAQFLSQLWHYCIVVSWVGTPVDTIGAQVVDQVLKEVPARNQATR